MDKGIEFGGFVLNRNNEEPGKREYKLLFTTPMSALLARNRAKEKAEFENQGGASFDPNYTIVMQREVCLFEGSWMPLDEEPVGRRRRGELERDIAEAKKIIYDGLLRYKKKKLAPGQKPRRKIWKKPLRTWSLMGMKRG